MRVQLFNDGAETLLKPSPGYTHTVVTIKLILGKNKDLLIFIKLSVEISWKIFNVVHITSYFNIFHHTFFYPPPPRPPGPQKVSWGLGWWDP